MITQALVANGARVYITGRREGVLQQAVKQYAAGEGSLHYLVGDVSKRDECVRLAEEMQKREPYGLQLLVNNAGIARDDKTKFCMPMRGSYHVNDADSDSEQRATRNDRCKRHISTFPSE